MQRHFVKIGVSFVFIFGSTVLFVHLAWLMVVCVYCSQLSQFGFLLPQSRDGQSSSAFTVPSIDDYLEHNVWNPVLEMLFLEQVCAIFASYLVEIVLDKIALSCNFTLDLLCYMEEVLASAR